MAENTSRSLAQEAYQRLHHEIANATLAPGEKLLIRAICERYGIGLSPVREALNRLSGERLVLHNAQKGFLVAPLSEEDLDDILRARCWVNEIGLRESIKRGDMVWEERVVIACHRLSRTPRFWEEKNVERNPAWEEAHRLFHERLVSACGSVWIREFCEQLFHASERYRHLARVAAQALPLHTNIEHQEIMQATVSRNSNEAVRLLNEHFNKTVCLVRTQLTGVPPAASESQVDNSPQSQTKNQLLGERRNAHRKSAS